MATRQQIEQALNNPNVRKMLNLIAATEGVKHGYNTLFGNQRIESLNSHPNIRKSFKQTDGRTNYTTAAGRYQFLNGTWSNLAKRYGFTDFSARNQDLGAVALIAGRGALNDVMGGNWQGAIKKLGAEWASLPSSTYAQNKRGWDFVNKHLGSNITSLPQQKTQRKQQAPQPKFISSDMAAKLFPNQQKQQILQPKYLDDNQVKQLFGQQQVPQQSAQPNYLPDDQVAKLFPKV